MTSVVSAESRISQMLRTTFCSTFEAHRVFGADEEADVVPLSTLNNLINLDRTHLHSQFSGGGLPDHEKEMLLRCTQRHGQPGVRLERAAWR